MTDRRRRWMGLAALILGTAPLSAQGREQQFWLSGGVIVGGQNVQAGKAGGWGAFDWRTPIARQGERLQVNVEVGGLAILRDGVTYSANPEPRAADLTAGGLRGGFSLVYRPVPGWTATLGGAFNFLWVRETVADGRVEDSRLAGGDVRAAVHRGRFGLEVRRYSTGLLSSPLHGTWLVGVGVGLW